MSQLLAHRRAAYHVLVAFALATALGQTAHGQAASQVAYYNPVWSPDGRALAFESNRDGQFAIYVVGADGSGLRKLTPDGTSDTQPGWSPDGRQLVFTSAVDGVGHLWLMELDGKNRRRLTNSLHRRDFFASFSPDGRWIVLGAQDARNRANYYVDVVAVDGTQRRELTDSTHVADGPRWTSDGARIVFSRMMHLERKPGESGREYVARVGKTRQTASVRRDGTDLRVGRDADEDLKRVHDPALSPDSHWMADGKVVDGIPGIYVREVATGRERRVVGDRPR